MNKRFLLIFLIIPFLACQGKTSPQTIPQNAVYQDTSAPIEDRIKDLMSYMTLEEKVGQMAQVDWIYLQSEADIARYHLGSILSGGGSNPNRNTLDGWADHYDRLQNHALNTRLGIPIIYGTDAVHGNNHLPDATIYPHNIGLGAANDPDLVKRIARATAEEVAATGIDWTFAPCITVPRDERWGRTYEGFSEDPLRVGPLGVAAIEGYQDGDLSRRDTILATAKHFVADGGTKDGVDRGDAQIDEKTLREIHLSPYQPAINAGAGSIMASFSSWNGQKMHGNSWLLQDVLRDEMYFNGLLVSDWAALTELPGTYEEQLTAGINAGIDMVMIPDDYKRFTQTMIELVEEKQIPMKRINEAVERILRVKMELRLFEQPLTDRSIEEEIDWEAHRALGREATAKSLVLLKNEGLLPLSSAIKNIAVIGPYADDIGVQCGGWTIDWQGKAGNRSQGTSILEAVKEQLGDEGQVYTSLAQAEGKSLDAIIVVIGEEPYAEMMGDNKNLRLPLNQREVVQEASETGVPVVTLLLSGRPLMIQPVLENSDAFAACWLPGTEAAGITDVLFGAVAPTGTLPCSWPRSIDQLPINIGDDPYDPLFPMGFGLNYR